MVTAADWADVSHHQESVNLAAYAAAGHRWIGIKATGGASDGSLRYVDPMFSTRWRQAGQLGLHRVAYHYARNCNSGAAEFAWCLSQINAAGGLTGLDVLCYDQEDTMPSAQPLAVQRTGEWMRAAVTAGVTSGWVYSGKWYMEPAGLYADNVPDGWQNLWISDYTPGQPDSAIEIPRGWDPRHVVARQFTDHATVPGIGSACDYNRMIRVPARPVLPPRPIPLREVDMFVAVRDGVPLLVHRYGMVPLDADSLLAFRKVLPVVDFTPAEIVAMRKPLGMPGLGDVMQRDLATLSDAVMPRLESLATDKDLSTLAAAITARLQSLSADVAGISRPDAAAIDVGALAAYVAERLQALVLDGLQASVTFGAGTHEP